MKKLIPFSCFILILSISSCRDASFTENEIEKTTVDSNLTEGKLKYNDNSAYSRTTDSTSSPQDSTEVIKDPPKDPPKDRDDWRAAN